MSRPPILAAALAAPDFATGVAAARGALVRRLAADARIANARAAVAGLRGGAEEVAAGLLPLMAERGWIDALLAHATAAAIEAPLMDLPLIGTASGPARGLLLAEGAAASLSLVGLAPGAGLADCAVRVDGRLAMLMLLSGSVDGEWWRAGACGPQWSSAAAAPARLLRRGPLPPGEIVRIDGRVEGAVLATRRGAVLLRATIRAGAGPFARSHARADGRLLGAAATDEAASRAAMLASMLAAMGRRDAVPAVAALLDEPDHSLRWLAVRLLCRLDGRAGAAALERLARDDPHPDVRRAAGEAAVRLGLPRAA